MSMDTPRTTALTSDTGSPRNAVATTSKLPERSLARQQVLEEDEYTAALSAIIARDFFPSLQHLDATNDFLDAERSGDEQLLNQSVRRLADLNTPRGVPFQTPGRTPHGGDPVDTPLPYQTPARSEAGEPTSKRRRIDTSLSLDEFQARYTSEDNSSFAHILNEENERRREKYGWAWEAQRRVEAQRDKMIEGRKRALIEPAREAGVRGRGVIEAPTPAGLLTRPEEERDSDREEELEVSKALVRSKSVSPPRDILAPIKDTRSAGVDGWKFRNRNALMFPPDADSSPYDILENGGNDGRIIKHVNTRVDDASSVSGRASSEPPSPTRSRIDAAILGTPYRPRTPPGTFNLVPHLPSLTPSKLGPSAVKQLMTMGTLGATPRVLTSTGRDDLAVTPSTPFHLPAPTARESLSHRLSNRASKNLRTKAALMSGTPRSHGSMGPPSSTPARREGALTPAARRLLDRSTMGTAASRRAEVMSRGAGWEGQASAKERDMARVRWTPTPSPVTRR